MAPRNPALTRHDARLRREGYEVVVGVDEAGRGPLAGPVVAAAVVLPQRARLPGLDDSKRLVPEERAVQAVAVRKQALAFGWCFVGPRAIDRMNIRQANFVAMRRAIARMRTRLARAMPIATTARWIVIIDGNDPVPNLELPQRTVIGGDGRCLAVAAASVIAKTVRDGFMTRLALEYPSYGFEHHKGYSTPEHLEALDRHGPCRWHRYSYEPVAQTCFLSALDRAGAISVDPDRVTLGSAAREAAMEAMSADAAC